MTPTDTQQWPSDEDMRRAADEWRAGNGPTVKTALLDAVIRAGAGPEVERWRNEAERERQRLCAISVLATSRNPARLENMLPEYDSAALQDVRAMLADLEAARADVQQWKERQATLINERDALRAERDELARVVAEAKMGACT